jgi:hypothetical protein
MRHCHSTVAGNGPHRTIAHSTLQKQSPPLPQPRCQENTEHTERTEHTEHTEHTENLEVRCLPPTAYFSNIWAGSEDSEEFFDLLRNDAKTVAGESFLQCAMREGVFNSTGMYVLYVFRSVMCV